MFDTHYTRTDFSKAAPDYDAHALLQHQVRANLLNKAITRMRATGKVLDAGCGTGKLAQHLPKHEVISLDAAFGMCRQAASINTHVVCAPVNMLPFADASFDVVFSSLVLQWVENAAEALAEMRRVLKPGGLLSLSYLSEGTLKELKESFAAWDDFPHISDFPLTLPHAECEIIVEHYADLHALMRYLKAIGARNKHNSRRKSLMTRTQLAKVEAYYKKHYATPQGLQASWHVEYYLEVL